MRTSESINELAAALAKAQKNIGGARKDGTNPHFKSQYATLASVWAAWQEVGPDQGLSVIQTVGAEEDASVVATRLCHNSGQWIESEIRLALTKNDMQGLGSAISYARRYSLMAITGIAPADDDDGNAAVQSGAKAAPKKAAPKQDPSKWADGFIKNLRAAQGIEELNGVWEKAKAPLDKLQSEHANLYDLVGQAYDQCRNELEAAESKQTTQAAE